jgi:hypothetical protein
MSIGAAYMPGYVWGHHAILKQYQAYTHGLQVELGRVGNGNKDWHASYGQPRVGVCLTYHDLGPHADNMMLGLFPFADLLLHRSRGVELSVRLGAGLGYNPNPWNPQTRPDYMFTGSKLLGTMQVGLLARVALSRRISLQLGGMMSHYSVANVYKPNTGHNIPEGVLGLHYRLRRGEALPEDLPVPELTDADKKWLIQGMIALGTREMKYDDQRRFTARTVGLAGMRRLSPNSALGLGADLFHSRAIHYRHSRDDSTTLGFADQAEASVKLCFEQRMGRVAARAAFGVYVFSKERTRGPVVQRLGLFYYPFEHIYIGAALKTHWAKSDYLEWTLGFSF